jgi:hypothetical protein
MVIFSMSSVFALAGRACGQVAFGRFELGEQLGSDGEQVAAGELGDLADVAEARAHDDGLVAELLVVVVDRGDGLDAGSSAPT